MNPTRVWAQNYRTFEELDLELPTGCFALLGPNGSGKSSIVNLIELALFADGRELPQLLTTGVEGTELELGVEFAHRGELYRVRRSYSARGRGISKLDFEILTVISARDREGQWDDAGEGWRPLTRETARETQAAIEQLLGLTRETFTSAAFLRQGDRSFADPSVTPGERKAILAEVLGLELWDRLLELVRTDRGELATERTGLAARLEAAEAQLAQRAPVEGELAAHRLRKEEVDRELADAEQKLRDAETYLAKAREAAAVLRSAEELVRTKADAMSGLDRRLGELTDEDIDIQEALLDREALAAAAGRVDELETRVAELGQASAEYADYLHSRAEAERMVAQAQRDQAQASEAARAALALAMTLRQEAAAAAAAEEAYCQTCGQPVHGEAKAKAIADLERQSAEAEGEAAGHDEMAKSAERIIADGERLLGLEVPPAPDPVTPLEAELVLSREAKTRLAVLEERAKRLDAIHEEVDRLTADKQKLQGEWDAAAAELRRLQEEAQGDPADVVERRVEALRDRLSAHRSDVEAIVRAIGRCEALLDQLGALEASSEADRRRVAELVETDQVLIALEKAFGRDGIPALVIENAAIPQIETEANRILAELGTAYRVELRTQRALKTREGLKEGLDVIVLTPTGERDYRTYSGGEQTRIDLALRIALARLLAHRRGAEISMLVLDEPQFLDEAGVELLIQVLGMLTDFERVALVSHVPALREAFDQVIEIAKDGDRSVIVGPGDGTGTREDVAA